VARATALVTGGSGFLGSHLADALAGAGFEVRTIDLVPPPEGARHDFSRTDVRDAAAVREATRGCDVVVDNAALVPISGASLEAFRDVNVQGCRNVLDAARAEGAYVVHVSSSSIYGVPDKLPVTVRTPLRPFEDYGRSKAEAERLVESHRREESPIASLRSRALMGAGRLGIFDIVFSRVRAGKLVPVMGADSQVQMCHVDDFSSAVLAAIERRSNGTYNVASEEIGATLRDDMEAMIARVGSSSRIVAVPPWLARTALPPLAALRLFPLTPWHWRGAPASFEADLEDTKRELGWRPAYSNVDALVDAYEAFLRASRERPASPHRRPLAGPLARLLRR
jgi:nucleoside-diphosphate-sugar epimerase